MRIHLIRGFLWALVLGLMVMIFSFSAQGAEDTMQTSSHFAEPIAKRIVARHSDFQYEDVLTLTQLIVRKTGHFMEYAALGAAITALLLSYASRRPRLLGWGIATLYAATDELHQLIGGERSGMWQDVVLDSAGALAGALILFAIVAFANHKFRKE